MGIFKEKINFKYQKLVYPLVWILACLFIFLSPKLSKDQSSFVGVVGSRPVEINRSYPVKISKILVISGEHIQKGTRLAELTNPELDLNLSRVRTELIKLSEDSKILSKLHGIKSDLSKLESLKKELTLYEKQKSDLNIVAKFDGIVQSINFKVGESVEPYRSIIAILQDKPTHIRGYVHEKMFKKIELGQPIKIHNLDTNRNSNYTGKVVSFGSSIVTFPSRLLKNPEMPTWGREVLIQITSKSNLILGEKVYLERIKTQKIKSHKLSKKLDANNESSFL